MLRRMFVGHYGVSFAGKKPSPRLSLGLLFLAVQLLDILFALFVLLGIEKAAHRPRLHGSTTPSTSTGCPTPTACSGRCSGRRRPTLVALAGLRHLRSRDRRIAAGVLGAAVFSHFLLDLPMHTPDLPLGFDPASPKWGWVSGTTVGRRSRPSSRSSWPEAPSTSERRARSRGWAIGTAGFGAILVRHGARHALHAGSRQPARLRGSGAGAVRRPGRRRRVDRPGARRREKSHPLSM